MKVHLIKEQTVRNFIVSHGSSKSALEGWINKIHFSDWEKPEDMKKTFGSVDFLGRGSSRVVFDLGGNNYRIIAKYTFGERQVHLFVCWIGTHAEYDKLCKENLQFDIVIY